MAFLADLWLPILASAAAVFVLSSVVHMVLHWHKGDVGKLTGEDEVLEAMRAHDVKPGSYMFPCPDSMKEMGSPEMIAKYDRGPVGFLTVLPSGGLRMGRSLVQWFLFSVLISFFTAYIGNLAIEPGAGFKMVLRITGATATVGYAASAIQDSIWKGQRWGVTGKFLLDGLLYGVATGLVFAWLWPCGA
jgi:hypothetical protein